MGRPIALERELERFLGAGLADRAGDADDFRLQARSRGVGKLAQGVEHVRHHEERRAFDLRWQHAAPVGGNDSEAGAGVERIRHEAVAIAVVAGDREECFTPADAAAVDRET